MTEEVKIGRLIAAPAGFVIYNANIFDGYEFFITTEFYNSKEQAEQSLKHGFLPKCTHYTCLQDVIFPLKFKNGVYCFDFDENKYPKRDKDGYWKCKICKEKKQWSEIECCTGEQVSQKEKKKQPNIKQ